MSEKIQVPEPPGVLDAAQANFWREAWRAGFASRDQEVRELVDALRSATESLEQSEDAYSRGATKHHRQLLSRYEMPTAEKPVVFEGIQPK